MIGTGTASTSYKTCDAESYCDFFFFLQCQKQDESLQGCLERAVVVQQGEVEGEGYFLRDQVLYYKANPDDSERLVVSKELTEQVLKLGHNFPWAGYLGPKKTLARIARRFYWPGLSNEIQHYCESYSVCQLAGKKRVPKFPLQPLKIMKVPFSHIQ